MEKETVFDFYERKGFGLLTPSRAHEITEWEALLGAEKVLEAMQKAINNKVPDWSYVQAILKNSSRGQHVIKKPTAITFSLHSSDYEHVNTLISSGWTLLRVFTLDGKFYYELEAKPCYVLSVLLC